MTLRVQETIIVKRGFICVSFICINRGFIIKRAFFIKRAFCIKRAFFIIRCSPALFFSQRVDLLGTRQRGIEPLEHKLKDRITLAATGRVKL